MKFNKIAEFCGIPHFLRKKAIRAEMTQNTYKIPLEIQPFGASAQNGARFRGKV